MSFFKKIFFAFLAFFSFQFSVYAWEKVPVVIEFKAGGELHTFFYCFDSLEEGKKLAEENFGVKNFDRLANGSREKIMPVPLGTNVGLYDWAIFCYGDEFWLFEVRNGYLYGRGRLL
ncbi:MAG: hypothetical protein II821_04245 [Treponema sp.]|nr:hypothetical protein [Treponema sp.]